MKPAVEKKWACLQRRERNSDPFGALERLRPIAGRTIRGQSCCWTWVGRVFILLIRDSWRIVFRWEGSDSQHVEISDCRR